MNKTKMIATIGPSSRSKEVIKNMITSGVDVIRINMSHSSFEEARDVILKVREVNRELSLVTGIMIDTKGPEIRINKLENNKVRLEKGNKLRITKNNVIGDNEMISISLPVVIDYIRLNQNILLNDGSVSLKVLSKSNDTLICEIENDGYIKSNCSINIPDADFDIRFLSDYDRETIKFSNMMDIDYLALSHVKNENDILDINDLLIELGNDHIQIISKIENKTAVSEIDNILKVSDGVMVARGDLGIEIDLEKIPSTQKMIARRAGESEKICIIATEMLSSMIENPRPTRAEVSDIANAVIDGTDAIMLSSETAIGRYPVETVMAANQVIDEIEKEIDYNDLLLDLGRNNKLDISDSICYSAVDCANKISAKVIVCSTLTGKTAKKISHYRPYSQIIAISPDEKTVSSLSINYGIIPIKVPMMDTTDEIIDLSIKSARKILKLRKNDKVVITGSFPITEVDYTNFIKIYEENKDEE